MKRCVAYQWVEDLGEVSGCVVLWGTPGRHDRAERNIGLVNLGLTEETWAGGCRGLEMTVRWCVVLWMFKSHAKQMAPLPTQYTASLHTQTGIYTAHRSVIHALSMLSTTHWSAVLSAPATNTA